MTQQSVHPLAVKDILRRLGLVLAFTWGGFWTLFGLLSGIGEGLDPPGVLMHLLVPGLLFLAGALVALRWRLAGVILLAVLAVLSVARFGFAREPLGFAMLPLPGLLSAALLLAAQVKPRI